MQQVITNQASVRRIQEATVPLWSSLWVSNQKQLIFDDAACRKRLHSVNAPLDTSTKPFPASWLYQFLCLSVFSQRTAFELTGGTRNDRLKDLQYMSFEVGVGSILCYLRFLL